MNTDFIPVGIIKHLNYRRKSIYHPDEEEKKYGKALLTFGTNSGNFYYLGHNILYEIKCLNRNSTLEHLWEWFNC